MATWWWRSTRGRIFGLVGILLVAGAPAVVLRAACAGNACDEATGTREGVPFCSLPHTLRASIVSGFRPGRSPDLFVVDRARPAWDAAARVPLVFAGTGVRTGSTVPAGTTLDAVAPTIASIIKLTRLHPEVRSGEAVEGVASGEVPRLVLEIVWRGGDADRLRSASVRAPVIEGLLREGAGTLDASSGALPLDPVATMTTIGTGGLPSQHGVTGRVIRSETGRVVRAWGPRAPTSIIATLPDDLDQRRGGEPRIGLLGNGGSGRGLIGGNWYIDVDRDDVVTSGAGRLLASGYGDDAGPDFFAAVLSGSAENVDRRVGALMAAADEAAGGSVLTVFTATGDRPSPNMPLDAVENSAAVEAVTTGGVFLDQDRLATGSVTEDDIVAELATDSSNAIDVFSDTAVTFSRFC